MTGHCISALDVAPRMVPLSRDRGCKINFPPIISNHRLLNGLVSSVRVKQQQQQQQQDDDGGEQELNNHPPPDRDQIPIF